MKWYKHMSDASHGSDLTLLEEEFGLEGYARWFKLLEAVAQNADPKKGRWSCAHPWSKWQQILKGKRKKLETFLEYLQNNLGINQKLTGNVLEIEIPNLKKFKDEYSRKSGQGTDSTCARVPEAEEEEEEKKREREGARARVDPQHDDCPETETPPPERQGPKKTPYPSKGRPSHRVFKACLEVYTCGPVNEDEAWCAWCDMEDRGMLVEDIPIIRDRIIELSQTDDQWKEGFAPSFTKCIKTRAWRNNPFRRPESAKAGGYSLRGKAIREHNDKIFQELMEE